MSFTKQLREEADPLFQKVYEHPFVQGIRNETLEKEQLIHYVKQDYEYLNAMIQTRALTMAKCTTREEMTLLNEGIGFILNDETHPHNNFCSVAGVSFEDLQGQPLAPVAHHYSQFMMQTASNGTLGEALAAALPCPWIYLDIGERMIKEINHNKNHLFYDWIAFYGAQEMPRINQTTEWLDELAEKAGHEEREKMRSHFLTACRLEYMFFDMAYHKHDWPI
ncbi:thiaminase II [Bacillus sp. H-16]|uniref:thiaminase II n=1 Tax=Alteribacter salitolerans TaxID=2912333 RepID=UPI0019626B6F|nr:thiaminase II [Alteribacter salitolerans]MBM7095411.1 thiaminase II [Alteribacter salitolerans]